MDDDQKKREKEGTQYPLMFTSKEANEAEEGATNFSVAINTEVAHGSEQWDYKSGELINELTEICVSKPCLYHNFAIFESQYLFKELKVNNTLVSESADLFSMPKDFSLGVSVSEDMNMGYGVPILFRQVRFI